MTTTATKSTRKTVTAAEFDDVKHRLAELRAQAGPEPLFGLCSLVVGLLGHRRLRSG